ncbi:hypothetical protein [Nocardia inohanensis]|uniref:hypothetical protein n=1 Tax=Nocardia inohanensis TaxID=209246 RepID=UPI00082CF45C|nr:hypothetical protein [Nocardia inohanensis]
MIKKTLTVAALVAGAAVALAPIAGADSVDPTKFSDRTADFVPYNDPAALNAKANGKLLIVSPSGVNGTIACRGNGVDVAWYDCMQEDAYGWVSLKEIDTPLGKAWTTLPL